MVKSVSNIVPGIKPIPAVPGSSNPSDEGKVNFGNVLNQALNSVNQMQNEASQMAKLMAAGQIDDLHSVMIAGEKADLALQFTLQVRNKILDAYNEIMRMQI